MKGIESDDQHLVVHDATTVAIATTLGVVASVVTGDPMVGAATTGTLSALGIGAMEVGPIRRTVNRAALAVADAVPGRKK